MSTQNYWHKDPNAVLDYQINWADWLGGDSIATSAWTVPSGITEDSSSNTSTTATIWVSSGTAGSVYELVNRITTAAGRTADRSIFIEVVDNRVHTIGGRNIEVYVRQEVADDVQPYEYETQVLNNAIAQAVKWYTEMRPYIKEYTFTVVKDQQTYQLPTDALRVTELHYKRSDTDTIYERLSDYYPFEFTDVDSESLTMIQQKLLRAFEEYAHYFWEQVTNLGSYKTGRWVVLYPPPDNNTDTVYLRYTREHVLSSGDYPTIPWEDGDAFVDLVVLALDRRELARMKRSPARYRDGQTEVDRRATMTMMRQEIDNRWQRVRDSLGHTTILVD